MASLITMPIETDADRLVFVSADDFGVRGTILGVEVQGILDSAYLESAGFSSSKPIFTCKSSDVTSAFQDAILSINGVSYTVRVIELDGTGMTNLVLES